MYASVNAPVCAVLSEDGVSVFDEDEGDEDGEPDHIHQKVDVEPIIGGDGLGPSGGQVLHGQAGMGEGHELDGCGEHQSQAPGAEGVDHVKGLGEEPISVHQGRQAPQPSADGEPAGNGHASQTDDGDGHENGFGRDAEEGVGKAETAEFDEFRLPAFGHGGAGNRRVDVAGEFLARVTGQLQGLSGQGERDDQGRDAGQECDQVGPNGAMASAGSLPILCGAHGHSL